MKLVLNKMLKQKLFTGAANYNRSDTSQENFDFVGGSVVEESKKSISRRSQQFELNETTSWHVL